MSISDRVNTAHRDELIAMGYSKIVSEKALFMTGNKGIESGLNWIEEHTEDADFNEELFIVAEEPSGPKLSPEEA